jgi:hypothetical protein
MTIRIEARVANAGCENDQRDEWRRFAAPTIVRPVPGVPLRFTPGYRMTPLRGFQPFVMVGNAI